MKITCEQCILDLNVTTICFDWLIFCQCTWWYVLTSYPSYSAWNKISFRKYFNVITTSTHIGPKLWRSIQIELKKLPFTKFKKSIRSWKPICFCNIRQKFSVIIFSILIHYPLIYILQLFLELPISTPFQYIMICVGIFGTAVFQKSGIVASFSHKSHNFMKMENVPENPWNFLVNFIFFHCVMFDLYF